MGFAVQAAKAGQIEDLEGAGGWDGPPTSFLGAVQAAWDDQRQTRNTGVRRQALVDALWDRHRAIERATGERLPKGDSLVDSDAMMGRVGRLPGVVSDDEYERRVAELRQKHPDKMAGIATREAVIGQLDARLRDVRARGEAGFRDHPVGAFAGAAAGTATDPLNVMAAIATGGWGASRPLLARAGIQALANAGVEAASVPARIEDAQVAGPDYSAGEAVTDVAGAAVFGGVFELGGAGVRWGFRRAFAGSPVPAARYTAEQVDQAVREDLVLGPLDGAAHEEGLAALDALQPPPRREAARELGDLFATGGTDVEYYGRRISQGVFDPREIGTDAATFQYKADADAQGVTARLRGVEVWDPTSSGKVIVFERADGSRVIADGHQRRGLALRMDEAGWDARLDGYLFREADGWSPKQVRTIAALKNIREGSGTILDAAKVFRDAPELLADRSLPVTGDFISQARALARLDPEAFGAVINKVIPERYAAEIGAMAGHRPDLHPALVKLMKEGKPASVEEARALVSEAMLDDWVKAEGEQVDFFGGLPPESTTIARAKVKAAVAAGLRKDARIYGQLVKHADAIEAGGNVLIRDANEVAASVNRTALEVIGRLSMRSGEVGEAMAAAARQVLDGKRPGEAAKGIVAMVRNRLQAGEALEGVRAETIAPDPPSPAARQLLESVDDPKTWEAQARAAPEDAAFERAGPPGKGDLWQLSRADLQRMLDEKSASDDDLLIRALGPEGAAEFKRLDAMRNSTNPARADEGGRLFDEKFGNLTPEQERLIYGIGESDAQGEEIRTVLRAHDDVADIDPDQWIDYMAAVSARHLSLHDLGQVPQGLGSAKAQAAFVRMQAAFDQYAARGVDLNDVPARMANALVEHAGWRPEQAAEIIRAFVDDMTAGRVQAGLFDDLEDLDEFELAHQALVQCVPAPEAAE